MITVFDANRFPSVRKLVQTWVNHRKALLTQDLEIIANIESFANEINAWKIFELLTQYHQGHLSLKQLPLKSLISIIQEGRGPLTIDLTHEPQETWQDITLWLALNEALQKRQHPINLIGLNLQALSQTMPELCDPLVMRLSELGSPAAPADEQTQFFQPPQEETQSPTPLPTVNPDLDRAPSPNQTDATVEERRRKIAEAA